MSQPRAWFAVVSAWLLLGCSPSAPAPTGAAARSVEESAAPPKSAAPSPAEVKTAPPSSVKTAEPSPTEVKTAEPSPAEAPPADAPSSSPPIVNAAGETLLFDFSVDKALAWKEPTQAEFDRLLQGFPHPHAPAGAACDPNYPGTPVTQRAGGILLPHITMLRGAFTRAGSSTQTAYLIDYCLTGAGVPRTRRLLVLEKDSVELDHELAAAVQGEQLLHAADVNGDGRAELLMTASIYRDGKQSSGVELVQVSPGAPKLLGRWTAVVHCSPGTVKEKTVRRIFYRRKGGALLFRDEVLKQRCIYPPAPPAPR
jgi:hypothetical protein